MDISRRVALKAMAGAGASACAGVSARQNEPYTPASAGADRHKLPVTLFGSAVKIARLRSDPAYENLVNTWCDVIVAEGGMKWDAIHPAQDRFDFSQANTFLNFASGKPLAARGHTLVWHQAMPAWTAAVTTPDAARQALEEHVEAVVGYCAARVQSWDVANEVLPDKTTTTLKRRDSIWHRLLGDDYIALAFRSAARFAPQAQLVINEYDLEFAGLHFEHKRLAMLALLGKLRRENVPVHALGLEGHLRSDYALDRRSLRVFLKEVRQLGLDTLVTEMDVMDHALSADPFARDHEAASRVDEFLDTVFSAHPPTHVLTWGLTDRLAWIPDHFKRRDGLANRPLPLDEEVQPKEMMRVMERYRLHGRD